MTDYIILLILVVLGLYIIAITVNGLRSLWDRIKEKIKTRRQKENGI